MGQMTICDESRQHYAASVRVEEYKRPKFEVTLDAPKAAPKLNAPGLRPWPRAGLHRRGDRRRGSEIPRRAAGAHALVVVGRLGRRGGENPGSSQEIAHGTATSGVDGSFTIEFVAKPDPSIPEANEPSFVYEITADVTDSAGETRSDNRSIRVGYTAPGKRC